MKLNTIEVKHNIVERLKKHKQITLTDQELDALRKYLKTSITNETVLELAIMQMYPRMKISLSRDGRTIKVTRMASEKKTVAPVRRAPVLTKA